MTYRVFVAGFLALAGMARAQTMDAATRALVEKLQQRVDALEKRLADLEKGGTAVAAVRPVTTPQAAAPAAAHDTHDQPPIAIPAAEQAAAIYPALKITGFADVNFAATNLRAPATGYSAQSLLQSRSGFQEGQFILHMSSALSPKVTVFSELSFTARPDAGVGTPAAPGFNPEVERLVVRYDANDRFKLSFGRYHTPINYWNTAFHHGQWLQTTISRPEMTQFGGSFIPVHFVGTLVEGEVPAGGINLNYNLGAGNGRGQVISRPGDFGDVNNHRAWLFNAFIKPNRPYGLRVGGSVYRDALNPLGGTPAREWIHSGHLVWSKETPEIIAEFANVRHRAIGTSNVVNSQAAYAQVAYRLPWLQRAMKPYYRFEYIHVPRSDFIFRNLVPVFHSSTIGLRYDISSLAAFKVEYRDYSRRDFPAFRGIFTQTSFTF
jgi:hypothetical protein